jgi:hypothetical protein
MRNLLLYSLFLFIFSTTSFAQGPPPPPDDPSDVPIDGGLGFIVAGGIGYGIYQSRKNKQHNS